MIVPDSMNLIDNKEHFDIIKSIQVSRENFGSILRRNSDRIAVLKDGGAMKITKDIIMREIAGETVLLPVGELAVRFQGIMSLNETGVFLWKHMQEDCTEDALVQAIVEEYDTTEACARKDVRAFIKQLQEQDLLL